MSKAHSKTIKQPWSLMDTAQTNRKSFKRYSDFAKIFTPFFILSLITLMGFIYLNTSSYRNDLISESRLDLGRAATVLRNDLSTVEEDIISLSSLDELRDLMDLDYSEVKSEVETLLTDFLLEEGIYFKARILDLNGVELSAVEHKNELIRVLPQEELEDISDKPYFNEELTSLRGGVVYASRLDLNVENGVVEEPYRPTIRFLISLYGGEAVKRGYIALNFNAGPVLANFRNRFDTNFSNIMITDSNGNFLSSPDSELNWGYMFPERSAQTLENMEPEVWNLIWNSDDISFEVDGNFYQIALWCGTGDCIENGQQRGVLIQTLPYVGMDLPWAFISTLAIDDQMQLGLIISREFNNLAPLFLLLVLIAIIAAFMSWRYANNIYLLGINEENMRKSNALIHAFFDKNPDLMYLKDLQGNFLYANEILKNIFGVRQDEEIEGKNNYRFMSHEMADKLKNQAQQVISQKKAMEFYHTFQNGHENRLYRSLKFPIFDSNNNIAYVGTIAADITEKMRAEEALRTSEARFRAIFDAAPDLLMLLDNKGYIKMVNHKAETILSYPRARIIDQHISELLPFEMELVSNRPVQKYLLKDVLAKVEISNATEAIRYDGSRVPVEVFFQPVTSDKKIMYVCVVRDITERVKALKLIENNSKKLEALNVELEEERESLEERVKERTNELSVAMQQAEAASQAKTAFLATMSHEIRTPMNGIVGTVDMLMQGALRPREKEQAETIKQSAYSLLTIIEDVLDFSKIEAEKITFDNQHVRLSYLLESISNTLIPIANKYNVKLYSYKDPKVPATIIADPVRLRQIMTNLINNAIKFSSGREVRGEVSIRLERKDCNYLEIKVEDNGIGISSAAQRVIFDVFTQADSTTTRQYGGTGLGLPICQRLVELMDGEISVQSEPDKGSLFTCSIPIISDDSPSTSQADWLTGETCLLVAVDNQTRKDWEVWLSFMKADVNSLDSLQNIDKLVSEKATDQLMLIIVDYFSNTDDYTEVIQKYSFEKFKKVIFICQQLPEKIVKIGEQIFLIDYHPNLETCLNYIMHVTTDNEKFWERGKESTDAELSINKETPACKGRVLLAEDNAINQKVAKSQLEFLGYECDIADDGMQALELLKMNTYDLLLTDLHMPNMDGLTLARAVRLQEQSADTYMPILAFTADATKGEREKCIKEGMDGYISKPVLLDVLKSELNRLVQIKNLKKYKVQPSVNKTETIERKSMELLDVTVLEKLLGSNKKVPEFLSDFMQSAQPLRIMILEAFQNKDWHQLGEATHSLKSSSRSVGAGLLGEICESIESKVKAENLHGIGGLVEDFSTNFDNVIVEIKKVKGASNGS